MLEVANHVAKDVGEAKLLSRLSQDFSLLYPNVDLEKCLFPMQ